MLKDLLTQFTFIDNIHVGLADTAALAAVALIGYLFGHRTRSQPTEPDDRKLLIELTRATQIARELQQIAGRIREDVALHQANIAQFKTRLHEVQHKTSPDGWQILSQEAESLLTPTMRLATSLSLAYDELRKQSNQLMVFAGSRTDQETGLRNRRAMEEQLTILLSNYTQESSRFSLALFCIGHATLEVTKAQIGAIASLLEHTARDTDVVARYSPDEFVVLMPQTSLAGAAIFSQRLLDTSDRELGLFVFGGIVEVQPGDTPEKILSRADSALYSARSEGQSCLYQHTGKAIRPHDRSSLPESDGSPFFDSQADLREPAEMLG
ncbi:MAG: GGDEF domain-containing protein [Bythopirellula sp.]|nr:GGDEF domain-containing protein [Bythopirellula sp.]